METYKIPTKLDVATSPNVEKELLEIAETKNPDTLICDFSDTTYVSSAGLRVMLLLAKKMKALNGAFILSRMNDEVYNIFEMSGFTGILDIRRED